MRSGSAPTGHVFVPSARVTLNGANRAADAVSVSRELPRVLPGNVSSVGGATPASGSVEWSQADTVTTRVPTPWTSKAYPVTGQPVGVYASAGGSEHKIFTGVVDGSSSSFGDPVVSSGLADDWDQMDKPYSAQALSAIMPPRFTTGGARRVVGLHPHYVTTSLLRITNFMVTPNRESNCVLHAPLTGSTWPELGSLDVSRHPDDVGAVAQTPLAFSYSSRIGSVVTHKATTRYTPTLPSGVTGKVIDAPMQITLCVGESQSASGFVAAEYSNGWQYRLGVTSTGTLAGQIWDGSTLTNVVLLTGSTARIATLRVRASGEGTVFEIRTSAGEVASATTTYGTSVNGLAISEGIMHAAGNQFAGFQISFPAIAWQAIGHVQKLKLSVPDSMDQLTAIPALVAANVAETLRAQAEAECAAFWLDEDGVARWVSRTQLTAGPVVRTLTAANDLFDVKLRSDAQDTRRGVTVKYRAPSPTIAHRPSIELYEGSKDEVQAGDFRELTVGPGQDEDWIQPYAPAQTVYGDYNALEFNRGLNTFVGWTALDVDGNEVGSVDGSSGSWAQDFVRISTKEFHYWLRMDTLPAGCDRVTTSTRSEGTSVKAKYRNKGLPIVRGMGKLSWADKSFTSATTGPSWAPHLDHDLGWFVQSDAHAQTVANWIASQVVAPKPVVESVDVVPDPRIQLGDKVKIVDDARTGVALTGVVIGLDQSVSDGEHTMSLKMLVTLVETPNVTLNEFDAWYAGMTVDQVDAMFAGSTVDAVDGAPLR